MAQNVVKQYDPEYRPDFLNDLLKQEDELYLSTGIDKDMVWAGHFVRVPGADPDDLVLRMSLPNTVSGCYETSKPRVEIKYTGKNVRVEFTPVRINMQDEKREYSLHECDVQSAAPHMDIVLDRRQLIENESKNLAIMTQGRKSGAIIKINATEERVVTVTPIMNMIAAGQDPTNGNNIDIFWTYPENTVILYNEDLELNEENITKLANFAMRRGLVPITDYLPDFRIEANNRFDRFYKKGKHKMYFVDKTGAYTSDLATVDDVESIGKIQTEETHIGADGPYEKTVEIPVFMKRPGLYE
ncbi:MAG: hypothetical protein KTR28_04735 [Micavibrio sp.]|nr:hypothetical protein [Micavibrio sp.]